MSKSPIDGWIHEPLTAALSSRAKIAIIRALARASEPLAYREVVRRTGMAYRSIELALADLTAMRLLRESSSGGRERRVELERGHRLLSALVALVEAEADFFPAIRIELRAWAGSVDDGDLLSIAMVGAATRRQERLGDVVQIVAIARSLATVGKCRQRFRPLADRVLARFGVPLVLIGYDLAGARTLWRAPTAVAQRDVRDAELLHGARLDVLLNGSAS